MHARFILRAIVDFVGIILPFRKSTPKAEAGCKRILVFNWRDLRHTYAGGAEVYIHELSKRWVSNGHHVTLFCGSDGDALREEITDGIHVIRRGGFYMVYVWAFFYYIFRFRRKYDVIVDCHNGIPFFTPLYTREPVIGVVHHVHQDIFKEHLSKPKAALAMWLEAKLMPRAYNQSQLVAVSPSTKQEMEALGIMGLGIEIVYNGVNLETLMPGEKAELPTVLFLGRLQAYKSVDVLIKAFKQVKDQVPDAKLVIAGSGEAEEDLKVLAKNHKFSPGSLHFTGRVTDSQKISLLQKAWVAVNPSQMEGWGITTIEANACGTPVVGSDVPGLRDSIRHRATGMLVPYGKTKELADHITEFLKNDDMRYALSHHAHDFAQQFKWDVSADAMYGLIDRSLKQSMLAGVKASEF